MTSPEERTTRRRRILRGVVRGAVSIALVVGIFVGVMPRIADYSDVWATISDMTWLELVTLLAFGVWNLITYWFVLVAALPGLSFGHAAIANQASTAISNTLPGGGALGVGVTYAMYSSWGFAAGDTTRSIVITGIWNNFIKLGLPVLALPLLAFQQDVSAAWITASLVGVVVLVVVIVLFWLMLRSDRLAVAVGRGVGRVVSLFRKLVRRPAVTDWDARALRFRKDTEGLLSRRWHWLTLSAIVSHLSLYLVLLTALRHVGVSEAELSWIRVLAAFAFVRLISALPVTPGGLGIVELGYAAALGLGLDEATRAQVVAAILVFRAITYFLPVPLGAGAYLVWRREVAHGRAVDAVEESEPRPESREQVLEP